MSQSGWITKKRRIWQPGALRLLREQRCAQYARCVVAGELGGFRIVFPESKVTVGWHVGVESKLLVGRSLHAMLYDSELQERAVKVGLVALQALNSAEVGSAPFRTFSTVFRLIRGPRVVLAEMIGGGLLTATQRRTLLWLVMDYMREGKGRKVLVHGDLQAAHLLVDLESRGLGFIDLEAMCVGKAATNFAQLWVGYCLAERQLGGQFYRCFSADNDELVDDGFRADVRTEVVLRCHSHVRVGKRTGNHEMSERAQKLMSDALSGIEPDEWC